jgi:tRNA 2-thiouridine synthesizing protein A
MLPGSDFWKIPEAMPDTIIEIDVRGYNCPIPILRAKKALANMAGGELVRILTTDPGAEIDFKVFAEASGNELVSLEEASGVLTLVMRKRA